MKIYIDLLFIQDTLMMIILLKISSRIMRIAIPTSRLIIVSVCSNMISILLLIFLPTWWDNMLIKFLLSFLAVKNGFHLKRVKKVIPKVVLFWIIVFVIGGANVFYSQNGILSFLTMMVSIIVLRKYQKDDKKQRRVEYATCWIEWKSHNEKYRLKALIDTGHDVKSIYGENVIFVRDNFNMKGGDKKKREVTYKTLMGIKCQTGFKVNHICVLYDNKKIYNNAIIICTPNITPNFDAIIGYDLLEGGMINGDTIINQTKSKEIIS